MSHCTIKVCTVSVCVLLTLLNTVLASHQHRIVYVTPDLDENTLSKCPAQECYTLHSVSNMSDQYFVSNTTIALMEGTHIYSSLHNEAVIVEVVENFVLTAANLTIGATIECNTSFGLQFIFTRNLTISGITFESCGAHMTYLSRSAESAILATLYIVISHDVTIENVTVTKGQGFGLIVYNFHRRFSIYNSQFLGNQLNFGLFKLPYSTFFRDGSAKVRKLIIAQSKFIDGYMNPNKRKNNYEYNFSSGITVITFSSKDPSQTRTNIMIYDVVLNNNTGRNGNLHIEYNACTTRLCTTNLNSSNSVGGIFLRPRLFRSTYCTSITAWGLSTVVNSSFENASVYLSVLKEDVIDIDDLLETENPELVYLHLIFLQNVTIANNNADTTLFISYVHRVILADVTLENNKGENLMLVIQTEVQLQGQCIFRRNIGAIAVYVSSQLVFNDNCEVHVIDSQDDLNAPLHISYAYVEFRRNSTIKFRNNTGLMSGAIAFIGAIATFFGRGIEMSFLENSGISGGAFALYDKSRFDFQDNSEVHMTFIRNYASKVGGAIFVKDVEYLIVGSLRGNEPFFRLSEGVVATLSFFGNTAELAGCTIYGGWIDSSFIKKPNITIVSVNTCNASVVSSNPKRLCVCMNSQPDCNITDMQIEYIPGQSYSVSAVAVGQRFGIVPSTVQAQFVNLESNGELEETEYVQIVDKRCTHLTFTLRSLSQDERIALTIANDEVERPGLYHIPDYENLFHTLELNFVLKGCPYGFYLNATLKQCVCETPLLDHKIQCNSQTLTIYRSASKWINVTLAHIAQNRSSGVIVHDHCPFDYCIVPEPDTNQQIDLLNPDEQCTYNRSGILCGACQSKLSHVLGTSKCQQCTRPWILLIIPLVALAGLALVAGLMWLNLTVSVGTINGLIFYANIVRANQATFFPRDSSKSFLSIFVAWLNLDLGIETCFYDGLDAYAKTWFQFLFPFYIWFLVISIIVSSHYSTRVSRLSGNNAVQVLATLFLLSYAKLLRIIITTFSSTQLVYPTGHYKWVWLYDGNVDYFKGKHIPLFIASLFLLVFISLPYTMGLLCIQWLQRFSNFKLFLWVGKLLPLFDAYTGPYKTSHRYWTGLLLLIRACVFLVFSLNTIGDPTINLLTITALVICIFAYLSMVGGVYKQWYLNLIEMIFMMNLGILSATGLYKVSRDSSILPVTNTSVAIAFVLFIIISFCHAMEQISNSRKGKVLLNAVKYKLQLKKGKGGEGDIVALPEAEVLCEVTYSEVKLEHGELKTQ